MHFDIVSSMVTPPLGLCELSVICSRPELCPLARVGSAKLPIAPEGRLTGDAVPAVVLLRSVTSELVSDGQPAAGGGGGAAGALTATIAGDPAIEAPVPGVVPVGPLNPSVTVQEPALAPAVMATLLEGVAV